MKTYKYVLIEYSTMWHSCIFNSIENSGVFSVKVELPLSQAFSRYPSPQKLIQGAKMVKRGKGDKRVK